jgi:tetratricopeptide (TPR) repeat protein
MENIENKAQDAIKKNKLDEAMIILKHGIEDFPDNPLFHVMLSKCFLYKGDYPRSKEESLKAISLDPENAKAYVILGTISFLRGDLISARENGIKALEIDSNTKGANGLLANISIKERDLSEAEVLMKKEISIRGEESESLLHTQLASIYIGQSRFPDAIRESKLALKIKFSLIDLFQLLLILAIQYRILLVVIMMIIVAILLVCGSLFGLVIMIVYFLLATLFCFKYKQNSAGILSLVMFFIFVFIYCWINGWIP